MVIRRSGVEDGDADQVVEWVVAVSEESHLLEIDLVVAINQRCLHRNDLALKFGSLRVERLHHLSGRGDDEQSGTGSHAALKTLVYLLDAKAMTA